MSSVAKKHHPVLLQETLHYLHLPKGAVVLDGTLGLGGHAKALLDQIGPRGRLIGFDLDADNLEIARRNLESFASQITLTHDNFSNAPAWFQQWGIDQVDGILLDLGLSSPHVDDPTRGFSFQQEGPLDMRFDRSQGMPASHLLKTASYDQLKTIFYRYGEEPYAPKMARVIVEQRRQNPLLTTFQFMNLLQTFIHSPTDQRRIAARLFQALRIAVNRELEVLQESLPALLALLGPSGRMVVLSYHSLEDRIVKRAFRAAAHSGDFELLTRKPVTPSESEMAENPRSRSAKLRAIARMSEVSS